jgi:tRNA(Ile)-lysidine synthase
LPTSNISGLKQKVLAYIRENKLVSPGEKLAVAVSGGPDSVCLLYILSGLRKELDIDLHVAHLNHQLRGEESEADAKYVAGLAKRLGIPSTIASRDVKSYQKKRRLSLEEAAREVRYDFLSSVAKEVGAAKVAIGHTSDDHIETVLMHLVRGSGIRGLRGLLPVNKLTVSGNVLTAIRPLLCLNRRDTTAFCRSHKLKPRLDASNFALQPLRNKVRHSLLPELRKYNPQISQALLRLSKSASDDLDLIEKEARSLIKNIISHVKSSVVINKKGFLALPRSLQRQILRSSIESLLGSLKDIEAVHIEDIIEALDKPAGKVIGLPFGINFTIEYDRYILSPDSLSLCPSPSLEGEINLKIPGKITFRGWEVNASVITLSEYKARTGETNDFSAFFDFDKVGKKLSVRHRLPADRFQPLGMANPKKLSTFMIDARIPRTWRLRIPIVCASNKILWVVGYRIGERYKVLPDTKKVLQLEFKRV